jgi:AmmeMemoRadiSam system protein A
MSRNVLLQYRVVTRRLGRACMALLAAGSASCAAEPSKTVSQGAQPVAHKEEVMIREHKSGEWSPALTDQEKATLFAIAEDTLRWCVDGGRGVFALNNYTLTDKLKAKTATFVTLKERDMLRGCIGSLAPVRPLCESVRDNAIQAALHDPRFSPVTPRELAALVVHVSILSPIRAIASLDEFKPGEHGIIFEKGVYRAVYLPEVAVEQGWTKEETLSSLCEKAGTRPDAWRSGAEFKVFSSVVLEKQ